MLNLFVLRHGKAIRPEHQTADFDRKLNKKGVCQINQVGYKLKDTNPKIQKIFASPAKRTKETALIVNHYLNLDQIIFKPDLYLCPADVINKEIGAFQEKTLLFVGHNNGISDFVNWLCETSIVMSTGMLVQIKVDLPEFSYLSKGIGGIHAIHEPNVLVF